MYPQLFTSDYVVELIQKIYESEEIPSEYKRELLNSVTGKHCTPNKEKDFIVNLIHYNNYLTEKFIKNVYNDSNERDSTD